MGRLTGLVMLGLALCGTMAHAQDTVSPTGEPPVSTEAVAMENAAVTVLEPATAAVTAGVPHELTLMMMIEQGGYILWVIMALGFVAFVLSIYHLLTLTPGREAPKNLIKRAHGQLLDGDLRSAYQMCQERDEYLALVLRAGLKMSGHERYVIQEAMESEGERGATALWQKISYLNNIANIAPLLGLLGTVWGMMQAFGAIAFEDAQVKGLTMAYSVAEAMITTAAGLVLAIPTMAVYFFLRGRVIKIIAVVEANASEFVELIVKENKA
ncbi:MAG: MotA/TolQ/ExbB proton channel family protein [Candidatus Hydrogenedentes bacterium]|nr:MotA/TolQ/ExbB proton channel family protein [Candidatus Hydrogenedentota bacterium]